ncbi:hypothetical protein PtB15_6B160 [Puccinia triticina]|nr:hypothetical protein PtB15_6B160 [Puccinia triticina]
MYQPTPPRNPSSLMTTIPEPLSPHLPHVPSDLVVLLARPFPAPLECIPQAMKIMLTLLPPAGSLPTLAGGQAPH